MLQVTPVFAQVLPGFGALLFELPSCTQHVDTLGGAGGAPPPTPPPPVNDAFMQLTYVSHVALHVVWKYVASAAVQLPVMTPVAIESLHLT